METITAQVAKTQFGELLMKAQREPVEISKHGKRVAVLMSAEEFDQIEALKLQMLRDKLARAEADIAAGRSMDGDQFFNQLMKEFDDE
ncbi:type II toxin-antitoxin system Phd/YefM family antitoxin [Pantoea sp. At-9b]|uniref:type II toxin-antitoxin system Phd/YefM family antitoxin n=1 Tax=Pantoea sp. (strain At-9b) TaxID=592316 RepID=UPI0001B3E1DD|nr:type II toxin-antitoxin system Phd/YefM family antitoxin [Pantoea sp. At-9b]ADU71491.1 prevent-host-death family protein [Pantoea sp. At-9b]